jgi:hypothetical protein
MSKRSNLQGVAVQPRDERGHDHPSRLNSLEEFKIAISHAARDAGEKESSREVAERFYEDQSETLVQFDKEWKVEKLATLIAKERAAIRRAANVQLSLGFRPLPGRFVRPSGVVVSEKEATLRTFLLWRRKLVKQPRPDLTEIDKRIAVMRPYSQLERGITWGTVVEKEAAKKPAASAAKTTAAASTR